MAVFKTINGRDKYHDANSKRVVIQYILNEEKMISGLYDMEYVNPANPDVSMQDVSESFGKGNGVQIRHIVVSFYKNEISDPMIVNQIANDFMKYISEKYQVVYAVHENTDRLHFHTVFNSVSYLTGQRYRGTKKEHYQLLNALKIIMRKYGVKRLYA